MRISNLTLGLVDTNAYFIENEESVILIDPSSESDKIIKKLNQIIYLVLINCSLLNEVIIYLIILVVKRKRKKYLQK